jgi:hypothetical protein
MSIDVSAVLSALVAIFKTPIVGLIKLVIILPLNLIPTPTFEVYAIGDKGPKNRPDLRELHTMIKGRRRLHLGSFLIAWTSGFVMTKVPLSTDRKLTCWGIYAEDYDAIQRKWTLGR